MVKKLREIKIYGLFGDKDYTIKLHRDGVTVLHGLNGCGKTTILRMINGFFSGDYSEFDRVPFNGVHFCFTDDTKICIFSTFYNMLIQECPNKEIEHLEQVIQVMKEDFTDLTPPDFLTDERLFFQYIDDNLNVTKDVYIDKYDCHDLRLEPLADKFRCINYEQIVPVLRRYEEIFSKIKEQLIQDKGYKKLLEEGREKDPLKQLNLSGWYQFAYQDRVNRGFLGENLFSELIKSIVFEDTPSNETPDYKFLFDIKDEVIPKLLESQRIFKIELSNTATGDPYNINNRFKTLINKTKEKLLNEVKKCHKEHLATLNDRFDNLAKERFRIDEVTLTARLQGAYDRIEGMLSQKPNIRKFTVDWDYGDEIETRLPDLVHFLVEVGADEKVELTRDECLEHKDRYDYQWSDTKVVLREDHSDHEKKLLSLIVDDIHEELDILGEFRSKIDNFSKFIHKFGFMPGFECDFTQGTMELKSGNSETGTDSEEELSIPLSSLSSGEQNLLLMIFDLIFDAQESSLILIDEPEISLHISWQNKFLKYVYEIKDIYQFDVIVATHSPDIIYDHWDWTVALGPGEE